MLEQLARFDRAAFYWINRDHQSAFLDWFMPFLSHDDKFKIFFLIVFVLLLVFGKGRGRAAALLVIPLIALSDQVSSNYLKDFFDRVRPCNVLPDVHLLTGCGRSYSMPSSHAANSAAAATHFILFYPRSWLPLGVLAFGIGYSRVYVGAHWPFDSLVGFLVGIACALTIQFAYRAARAAWRGRRSSASPATP